MKTIAPHSIKRTLALSLLSLAMLARSARAVETILSDVDTAAIDAKVKAIVESMTLDEKMRFMHGDKAGMKYDGPPAIPRLGIPAYVVAHGPYSARATFLDANTGRRSIVPGTFMSCSINFAASWDPDLVRRVAQGVGREVRSAGDYALAGPALNIVRDLRCGRSAEYFTEDPYLNARITVPFVLGLQSEHVIATLKHFACNNQEWSRGSIDVTVSRRALNEIYLPGFEYGVKEADAMGVMSAYNKVNGKWCAENPYLLDEVLRKRWGFKGFVMSDWSGTHSTVPTVKAGLDLEMPRDSWYGAKLKAAVESGEVSRELIDERVSLILRTMFVAQCFNPDFKNPPRSTYKSKEMKSLARELALGSIVLLKNEGGVLPFDRATVHRVAVIGPHANFGPHFNEGAYDYTLFQEGGSANVKPARPDMITPLAGVRALVGPGVEVVYSPGVYAENGCGPIAAKYLATPDGKAGLSATYFSDANFGGDQRKAVDPSVALEGGKEELIPEAGREESGSGKFSARWEGTLNAPESRRYTLELRFDGLATLTVDGKEAFSGRANNDQWWHQVKLDLAQGAHALKLDYRNLGGKGLMKLWWDYENVAWTQQAVKLAKSADAVMVFVGNSGNMEREGRDRIQGLELSEAQQSLINAVSAVNPKMAVVTFTAGVGMEGWIHGVPAVVQAMYPGEQAGSALADLLFGVANPSGKLTVSIPKSESQYPAGHWGKVDHIDYAEDIFVGYRYFDQKAIEPQFPFGHGLSYTTFEYGEPRLSRAEAKAGENFTVTVDVTNTGKRAGAEVVQLYVHEAKSSVPRPPRELKAFQKVFLQPGETKTVTLQLDSRSFAYFSEGRNDWVVEPGQFDLLIGSSSREIRRKATCTLD